MTLKAAYIHQVVSRKNFYRAAAVFLFAAIITVTACSFVRANRDAREIARLNTLSCQICKHELAKARDMKILFTVDKKTY